MPHEAKTVGLTVVPKSTHGGHDMIIKSEYERPILQDGLVIDEFSFKDMKLAGDMMKWLQREYPGHLWSCKSNLRHKVVMFNLPILMGTDWWYLIVLPKTDDICKAMAKGAGELLERYKIKRGNFVLDEFLEAREKHSRLVLPFRKIPT